MSLVEATEAAIEAATHLTEQDKGATEALLMLARKVDAWDQIVEYALDDLAGKAKGARPAVPQNDNVSVAVYLKACDQLGLTPSGRAKLVEKKPEAKGGKLRGLQSVPKPA